jgi:hypothetical protein
MASRNVTPRGLAFWRAEIDRWRNFYGGFFSVKAKKTSEKRNTPKSDNLPGG